MFIRLLCSLGYFALLIRPFVYLFVSFIFAHSFTHNLPTLSTLLEFPATRALGLCSQLRNSNTRTSITCLLVGYCIVHHVSCIVLSYLMPTYLFEAGVLTAYEWNYEGRGEWNGMEGKGEKFERKGIDEWVIQFIRIYCN